jgi:hypothetical protein
VGLNATAVLEDVSAGSVPPSKKILFSCFSQLPSIKARARTKGIDLKYFIPEDIEY